ncbi:MAG TPA: hypothetical protein VF228_18940 [Iamia sp.]
MRRHRVVVTALLALVLLAPTARPAGASTTWEWMFFDSQADHISRRQCRVFYSVDGTGLTTNNFNRLVTAAQAGAADMQTLTGVDTVYAGAWDGLDDMQKASLAPIRIYYAEATGPDALSSPWYGDTVRPKDAYGGEIILFAGPGQHTDAHLANLLRHEWGHQFNLGDTYDIKRNLYYSASAPASAFKHVFATNTAYQDYSQRMGDEDQPWGDGDEAGLWTAGGPGRAAGCFKVTRPTHGRFAFRVLKALYGSTPAGEVADVARATETYGPVAGASGALDMDGGDVWRNKGKTAFLTDAWTGLTGSAPTPTKQEQLEDEWDAAGPSPRPTMLASMANSAAAQDYQEVRQEISVVFANVLGRMPTAGELSTFTDWLDTHTYTQLADRLFRIEGDARYEPGS